MIGFPGSPKLQKGALLSLDPNDARVKPILVFQYNPESLSRSIQGSAAGDATGHGAEQRLSGPPTETISLDAELDATDQMEVAAPGVPALGIYPALSSLELLMYPSSEAAQRNELLMAGGKLEIIPLPQPLTLLVWGPRRVLPVRLSEFSITEEGYDPALNPIRAKVRLSMRVLTYQDLGLRSQGGTLFMGHHILKESLAAQYQGSVAGVLSQLLGAPLPGGR